MDRKKSRIERYAFILLQYLKFLALAIAEGNASNSKKAPAEE